MASFKELGLRSDIQTILEEVGFLYPTEIQKKAIPLLIEEKKIDFHGQAQTGTGKTLAFTIPLIYRIDKSNRHPQALIIVPTRELALQIYESIARIAKKIGINTVVLYGGVSFEDQRERLKGTAHIVVSTPGRLIDHIERKTISLKYVNTLVLDEADIMLDMGFKEEIDRILSYLPAQREIWLFSATIKSGIEEIKKKYMQEPVSVCVSKHQIGTKQTKQYYCIVPVKARLHAIIRFIQTISDFYGIIFCQTKLLASELADELVKRGYNVGALHGDMSQAHRNVVIKKFKQKEITILVATDVAARGIDVANLNYVINYSIPEDLESYVHRIGRTGRAGKEGNAITFINKSEIRTIQYIEKRFGVHIHPIDVPSQSAVLDVASKKVSTYLDSLIEKKIVNKIDSVALTKLVDTLTQEDIHKVLVDMLYEKFITPLDLEEIPYVHVDEEIPELQEIYISVGQDDRVTKDQVRQYLLKSGLKDDQIKKIRVIKRRTYIKLNADCTPELLSALRGKTFNGKRIKVNMTCLVGDLSAKKPRFRGREGRFRGRERRRRRR